MSDRPAKLPPVALLVLWGSQVLTLGEKVVWYHDWTLDQGGPDGAFISHASLSARLGGSLSAATISTTRQRLKRLTLHVPLERVDARNLGWVSVLPKDYLPRNPREAPGLSVGLDGHLRQLESWIKESSRHVPDTPERPYQTDRGLRTRLSGTEDLGLGGSGGLSSQPSLREPQLPSVVSSTAEKRVEKGVGARAPQDEKRDQDPDRARAEWRALEKLRRNESLTDAERALVRAYLDRHPPKERESA